MMSPTIVFLLLLQGILQVFSSEEVMLRMLHEVINATIYSDSGSSGRKNKSPYYHIPLQPLTSIEKNYKYSEVQGICKHVRDENDRNRVGCCTPSDVRHLYNVMISKEGKMVIFQNPDAAADTTTTSTSTTSTVTSSKSTTIRGSNKGQLPAISSVKQQAKINFNMPIEYRSEKMDMRQCTKYFNGTLHVIGRSTVKNVYHALSDNLLPLMSQIILDAYLAPYMLYQPRMLLTGFQGVGSVEREDGAVHMRLLRDLMPNGHLPLSKASGMCFRRVVWGHGPHMYYTDSLQILRKLVAKFARIWAQKLIYQAQEVKGMKFYDPFTARDVVLQRRKLADIEVQQQSPARQKPLQQRGKPAMHGRIGKRPANGPLGSAPDAVAQNHRPGERPNVPFPPTAAEVNASVTEQNWSKFPLPKSVDGRALKIMIYTRGNSGFGRTIQNEDILVQALRERGAQSFICCDFSQVSLEQQLYNALTADVIIGMHGAAITHGVFMKPGSISLELKTLYAYESNLFGLVADSRSGIHGQVDIKKYFRPGGQRPIDAPLIARVMKALDEALRMQSKLGLQDPTTVEAVMQSRGVNRVNENEEMSELQPSGHELCQMHNLLSVITSTPGDFVFGPPCAPGLLNSVLGPPQRNHSQICDKLMYSKIRELVGVKGESFHCHICTTFVG